MTVSAFRLGLGLVSIAVSACSGGEPAVGMGMDRESGNSRDGAASAEGEPAPDGADGADGGDALLDEAQALLGDGTLDSIELVEIYRAPSDLFCSASGCRAGQAVDLEFNPARPGELWVIYRQPYQGEPCEKSNPRSLGCELMSSKVAVISGADTDQPSASIKDDANSWHFMRLATSLAFADDDTFATVGEARTGNWMDDSGDFMGPTWWSSDPEVFAVQIGEETNSSHLDMLHGTPFGMGIAHDPTRFEDSGEFRTKPVFWAFNGQVGAIDRYDFKAPHPPGGDDHSDGTLHRYAEGQLKMLPGVPSHLEFASLGRTTDEEGPFGAVWRDAEGQREQFALYVADSGNQRVVRLDPAAGALGSTFETADWQISAPTSVEDAELEVIVPKGTIRVPSGLAVSEQVLIVSDAQGGTISAFSLDGAPLVQLDTGLGDWVLAGLCVGPDQRLYFVDWAGGSVFRIDPR